MDRKEKGKKVLFAVVYNLLKEDFEDVDRVESIERIITDIVKDSWQCDISGNEAVFSYPVDPTVVSPTVPIVCDVTLLPTSLNRYGSGSRIADGIFISLKGLFKDIPIPRNDILVIVRNAISHEIITVSY